MTHEPNGEWCALCIPMNRKQQPATHKVGEEYGSREGMRGHNYTNYLCCQCFGELMGPMAAADCGDNPLNKALASQIRRLEREQMP